MDGVLTTAPQLAGHSQHASDGSCGRPDGARVRMLRVPYTLCNKQQGSITTMLKQQVSLTHIYICVQMPALRNNLQGSITVMF